MSPSHTYLSIVCRAGALRDEETVETLQDQQERFVVSLSEGGVRLVTATPSQVVGDRGSTDPGTVDEDLNDGRRTIAFSDIDTK